MVQSNIRRLGIDPTKLMTDDENELHQLAASLLADTVTKYREATPAGVEAAARHSISEFTSRMAHSPILAKMGQRLRATPRSGIRGQRQSGNSNGGTEDIGGCTDVDASECVGAVRVHGEAALGSEQQGASTLMAVQESERCTPFYTPISTPDKSNLRGRDTGGGGGGGGGGDSDDDGGGCDVMLTPSLSVRGAAGGVDSPLFLDSPSWEYERGSITPGGGYVSCAPPLFPSKGL
jgi:hypothetical protein